MKDLYGTIFKIQKYSIHDGPGVRTTVFLKGCPLNCWWCHNPESRDASEVILWYEEKCIKCLHCISVCPEKAIALKKDSISSYNRVCSFCKRCIKECPGNALENVGEKISSTKLMEIIEKDTIFYDQSGGGVTFSGGEPLEQFEFLLEMLKKCRQKEINTCVDTCGYTSWERFCEIKDYVDIFLYDVKTVDSIKHKKYTGVSCELILKNLEKLSKVHKNIIVRIPVIPGVNDSIESMGKTGEMFSGLGITNVSLLPYHNMGQDKYKRLGLEYKLKGVLPPSNEKMEELAFKLKEFGLNVKTGG